VDLSTLTSSGPWMVIGAILAIGLGALFCFFGYRLFKIVLGIAGFIWGGFLVAGIVFNFTHSILVTVIAGLAGGIIFALLAVLLYYVGIFILGTYLGGAVGFFILALFGLAIPVWLVLILAVVGGILALIFQKFMIVLATSFVGSWAVVIGISYLVPKSSTGIYPIIALVSWIVLGLIGMIIQYRLTARKQIEEETHRRKKR
jgi:hypothetical protein